MFHVEMDGKRQLKLYKNYADPNYSLEQQHRLFTMERKNTETNKAYRIN